MQTPIFNYFLRLCLSFSIFLSLSAHHLSVQSVISLFFFFPSLPIIFLPLFHSLPTIHQCRVLYLYFFASPLCLYLYLCVILCPPFISVESSIFMQTPIFILFSPHLNFFLSLSFFLSLHIIYQFTYKVLSFRRLPFLFFLFLYRSLSLSSCPPFISVESSIGPGALHHFGLDIFFLHFCCKKYMNWRFHSMLKFLLLL